MLKKIISKQLSERTKVLLMLDYYRWKSRQFGKKSNYLNKDKLHLGCGRRIVPGWLNVDLLHSDYDVDLGIGKLPFKSSHFKAVASQHVIEHLDIELELIPLLKESNRVLEKSGEIWLSCPDMEKVCASYFDDKAIGLINDRKSRWPDFKMPDFPSQHMINLLFHQTGTHKNLFDFILNKTGFEKVNKVKESDFLERFPECPKRNDDLQSIYVVGFKA